MYISAGGANSFTSNFMSSNNKMGFFKKDENEGSDGDSFYGKNFLQRNNSSSDSVSLLNCIIFFIII